MSVLSEHLEFGRVAHDAEVRERAFAQQSPGQWDEARRLCLQALGIICRHETGPLSTTAANVQLAELSQRAEPETRALANHLAEGLTAFFVHAGYWD